MSCPCWSQYAGLARTGTSRARGQVAEMSYITPWGRRASTPRTFLLLVTTTKGIKIVPIVVCRRRAAAGLCNCASQHRLDLPGMVGLLRGCGSPGHSPRWGRVAAVPGGEEGCPSHSPDAQLDSPKPQSGAAAPCCSTARSSQLHPLPAACSENRWLHLHRPSLPFPGAAQLLQPLLPHAPAPTSMPALLSRSPVPLPPPELESSKLDRSSLTDAQERRHSLPAVPCSAQGHFTPNACLQNWEIKKGKSMDHSPAASMASAGAGWARPTAVPGQPVLALRAVDVPDFAAGVAPCFANWLAHCFPIPQSYQVF